MVNALQIRRAMIAAVAVAASAAAQDPARPAPEAKSPEVAVPSRPRVSGETRGNLFAGPKPVVRAPVKAAPVVAPKPSVPPFPYKYAGRVAVGNEAARIYLQKGSELVEIKKGSMLDDAWRVDAVSEDRIEVSFVPLAQQLTMSLASLTGEPGAQGALSTAAGSATSAASGRALASTQSQLPAVPVASAQQQSAPGAAPLIGGPILPSPAPGVQPRRPATAAAPAVQTNPVAGAPAAGASSPMNPGLPPPGTMPSIPPTSGRP